MNQEAGSYQPARLVLERIIADQLVLRGNLPGVLFLSVQLQKWSCTQLKQEKDLLILYRYAVLLKSCIPATTTTRLMMARISRFCQMTGSETRPVWKMTDNESET
jgi:hypothetical protein